MFQKPFVRHGLSEADWKSVVQGPREWTRSAEHGAMSVLQPPGTGSRATPTDRVSSFTTNTSFALCVEAR